MIGKEGVPELLARAKLFGALGAKELSACAAKFREIRFVKGEMLFARGDPGERLYLVREGRIRLAIGADEGRELSFQVVGPGDLFGEIALLDGRPRSAEAIALTPAVALSLERADFQRLRAIHPTISEAIIIFLCERLRDVSDKLEDIALYPLEARLARFLLTALRSRPETPGRRTPLELNFSQGELAQLLGASRPKINAALAALESSGAVGRTMDRLFCDRAKLMAIGRYEEE